MNRPSDALPASGPSTNAMSMRAGDASTSIVKMPS
jgi:hypothetical protein